MAYAAVISLKHIIERLLNSCNISFVPPSRNSIESAYKELQSLEEVLQRLDFNSCSNGERLDALDGLIRDAVYKFEDVIESHVSNHFLSQSEEILGEGDEFLGDYLEKVTQEINSFPEMVKEMKKKYIELIRSPIGFQDNSILPRIDFCGDRSKMFGSSDIFSTIISQFADQRSTLLETLTLFGMAGIGKTTLAKKLFEDQLISPQFDCLAFVTVGPKFQLEQIMRSILVQVNPSVNIDELRGRAADHLWESLKGSRYLIVLDDIWQKHILVELEEILPDNKNGSHILLTTRLQDVANSTGRTHKMCFLNEEQSWELLCEKVFGEEAACPPQLERAGKRIAKNCEGLPLLIVTVGGLLSKADKTPEYWNAVADKKNSVFMDANDQISKVLRPSYEYLPQYLKACFLYMGVFPQNYEIPKSKLIKLWNAEGVLEPNESNVEDFAVKCLANLVSKTLVIARHECSRIPSASLSTNYRIKTCSLHYVFWHLCIREAENIKFFRILNSRSDSLAKSMESQRRLCIHNNVLFGMKDVHNSMASISTVRSLLCTGPAHQYPVPLFSGLKLLRVLDAHTIRFYEFPIEVLKFVHLRYLALTYGGKLPNSISRLSNLQFLIVSRYLSIRSSRDPSYLPMEIWDMKELKHIQVMGSDLPDPCGALLPNLLTLADVSARSCTKGVLEGLPNLKKLGIRIELVPGSDEPVRCFDHISHIHGLETLKCVVVNPELRSEVVALPSLSMFPSSLKKLTLSGFGYPWEDTRAIASLPRLEILKLQCFAFRGPKWHVHDKEFPLLKYILIEDSDLVYWTSQVRCFPWLSCVKNKHCYLLEEIPEAVGFVTVDCSSSAGTLAKKIEWYRDGDGNREFHSSWDVGKLKS